MCEFRDSASQQKEKGQRQQSLTYINDNADEQESNNIIDIMVNTFGEMNAYKTPRHSE